MTVIKEKGREDFEDGTLAGCVHFLKERGVRWVCLKWTWNRNIVVDVPRRWPFTVDGAIRARYQGREIDDDYSYIGVFDPDVFRKWAEDYDCWDDAELAIVEGVLVGDYDGYDPDAKDFPDYDPGIDVTEYEDVSLTYYEYWDEKAGRWRVMP